MQNILVTGANGFIGANLIERLLENPDYQVYGLVRSEKNAHYIRKLGALPILGDITSIDIFVHPDVPHFDYIFHCAARVSNKDRERLFHTNGFGSRNIAEYALMHNVKRFIYLSSVSVISGHSHLPLTEDLPFQASMLYGESKIQAEKEVLKVRSKGLNTVILRPPMVYGEDEPHLLKYLLFLLRYRLLPLPGRGAQPFHLVYVKNLVEAMIYAMSNDEMNRREFFTADREILSTAEVFCIMSKAIGAKPPCLLSERASKIFSCIPFIGPKVTDFTAKSRAYSTEKLERTGFQWPYTAHEALSKSAHGCWKR